MLVMAAHLQARRRRITVVTFSGSRTMSFRAEARHNIFNSYVFRNYSFSVTIQPALISWDGMITRRGMAKRRIVRRLAFFL
jgi:hypothetical protein